jgi:hypothetical protein
MSRLHLDILTELRQLTQYGLAPAGLLSYLRAGTHRDLALPDLQQALRDLSDKSFVTAYESALGGTRWRITGLGLSALKEAAL